MIWLLLIDVGDCDFGVLRSEVTLKEALSLHFFLCGKTVASAATLEGTSVKCLKDRVNM